MLFLAFNIVQKTIYKQINWLIGNSRRFKSRWLPCPPLEQIQ